MASYFRQAREWATPTLKSSAFMERGVLTPEEFVAAGDELVYRCPTWQWESSTKPAKSYLPQDKQYLITRNVPCPNRCSALEGEYNFLKEELAANEGDGEYGDGEEWLVSSKVIPTKEKDTATATDAGTAAIEEEFDILDEDGEVVVAPKSNTPTTAAPSNDNPKENNNNDDDEYADMMDDDDAMVDDNILQDDDMAIADTATNAAKNNTPDDDNVLKVRTYDISITYDKYYQTPRIFLIGRNTNDQPLTAEEMMQDVMSDYANKTVTMESHPHVSGPHASIHPCQHGKVMKAIVRNLIKATTNTNDDDTSTTTTNEQTNNNTNKPPTVEMYLFIFLKFVSSMIPTINYDFTMDVQADTRK